MAGRPQIRNRRPRCLPAVPRRTEKLYWAKVSSAEPFVCRPHAAKVPSCGCGHCANESPRSLAYIEMRLILARVLWNFDLRLADDSKDWLGRQKIYLLWEKIPLNMYLTPRTQD